MREETQKTSVWRMILRGFLETCPQCGIGKLFKSYLKPVSACSHCGEEIGHIRADDAPAWLTIVIVGHILAPFMILAPLYGNYPDYVVTLGFLTVATVLTLALLPRCKGVFIALIWRFQCIGSEK